MKKIIEIIFLSALFTFSVSVFASAESVDSIVEEIDVVSFEAQDFETQENVGVSALEETVEVTPYGVLKPSSSSVWNLYTQGRYDFSGNATGSDLYTNYYLTGKSSVKIVITNHSSKNNLEVSFMQLNTFLDTTIKNYTVTPGATLTAYPPTISSSEKYYLLFKGPSNFSGYIE